MKAKGMAMPLVSIIVPTHNREKLLSRALHSVRAQTYPNIELLVIDDGSTDGTKDQIQAWQEEGMHIIYLRNDLPLGPCPARNRGIREATGTYICFLDDDDAFHPDRVSRLLRCIEDKPQWSFVCSDLLSIRKSGSRRSRKPGIIDKQKILWYNYATQSVLALREQVLGVGGFDESLTAAQDYDLFTRIILKYGPAYRLGEVLYFYHQEHEGTRISESIVKRFQGYYAYYVKFKSLMSRKQRAWHLYRLLKLQGKNITFSMFMRMVPPSYFLLEANDYFINHTSFYLWLNRLRKALRI